MAGREAGSGLPASGVDRWGRLPAAGRSPATEKSLGGNDYVGKCEGRIYAITSFGKNSRYLSFTADVLDHDRVHNDAEATKKDAALHLALSRISSEFDRESTSSLKQFFRTRRVPVIPTGSLKLDAALGIGGLPKVSCLVMLVAVIIVVVVGLGGRFVEIYGQEASGKTTLALHIIKQAQKAGGFCAYFDVENAMDPSFAKSIGIDTENLLFSRISSAENLLSAVDTLTKSGSVDVIVVDSVAALVPQCELDVPVGGVLRDVRSSSKFRQGIEDMGEDTCGGNALKFYSAVRLRLGKTELIKNEDEVTGLGISVQVVKNKLAPAMKEAKLGLRFGRGFCCESEVLELACEHGIILKEANGYLIEGEFFGNEHAAELYLAENEVVFDKMVSRIRTMLFNTEEIVGQYSCSTIHDVTRLKKPSFPPGQMKVQESGKQHNPQNVAVASRLSQEASIVQHRIPDEVMPEEHRQSSMDRHYHLRRPSCFADHWDEPGAANKRPRAPAGQFPRNASSEVVTPTLLDSSFVLEGLGFKVRFMIPRISTLDSEPNSGLDSCLGPRTWSLSWILTMDPTMFTILDLGLSP
ncbi:hypothetical protein TIFTF001_024538 [Ficus carica]|uniref:RecA family profile 1 domain-containing protein n=1 Tax=Ficus carica TaxID=3494 RepID=A0AA88ALK1_FICCA|nr:hypothetical protein TIFTF001_024538 [Ficus carica]